MADRIVLTGMHFYGHHGVFPEETQLGQSFIVDVELYTDLHQAGANDNLEKTIHYGHVYSAVKKIVEGPPFKLIEAVAEHIAQALLGRFPAEEVVVRVHKPKVPIPGPLQGVMVEVRRRRES